LSEEGTLEFPIPFKSRFNSTDVRKGGLAEEEKGSLKGIAIAVYCGGGEHPLAGSARGEKKRHTRPQENV